MCIDLDTVIVAIFDRHSALDLENPAWQIAPETTWAQWGCSGIPGRDHYYRETPLSTPQSLSSGLYSRPLPLIPVLNVPQGSSSSSTSPVNYYVLTITGEYTTSLLYTLVDIPSNLDLGLDGVITSVVRRYRESYDEWLIKRPGVVVLVELLETFILQWLVDYMPVVGVAVVIDREFTLGYYGTAIPTAAAAAAAAAAIAAAAAAIAAAIALTPHLTPSR
ncbi:hypothetical protein CHU98_g9036 [Xylaria longipes]|nr:hypothetical protein CHU98_g9036 [Xylaria longipes]